jgi:hypothetical protein
MRSLTTDEIAHQRERILGHAEGTLKPFHGSIMLVIGAVFMLFVFCVYDTLDYLSIPRARHRWR